MLYWIGKMHKVTWGGWITSHHVPTSGNTPLFDRFSGVPVGSVPYIRCCPDVLVRAILRLLLISYFKRRDGTRKPSVTSNNVMLYFFKAHYFSITIQKLQFTKIALFCHIYSLTSYVRTKVLSYTYNAIFHLKVVFGI